MTNSTVNFAGRVRMWGLAIKINEVSKMAAKDYMVHLKLLERKITGKKTGRKAISQKHVIIPATIEFMLRRPSLAFTADPYQNNTIIAAKVKSVRFSKLKKFKAKFPQFLSPAPKRIAMEAALCMAAGQSEAE